MERERWREGKWRDKERERYVNRDIEIENVDMLTEIKR